jgi:methylmalonyl-CoA/ethylmalonyl-CoA epimerase
MAILGIHQIAVAVNDIDAAVKRYQALGLKVRSETVENRWGLKACVLGTDDAPIIELLTPAREGTALGRFMKMRAGEAYPGGEGLYMIALRVDDVPATKQQLEAAGLRVTSEAESPNVVWVHPATNGNVMIELLAGAGVPA